MLAASNFLWSAPYACICFTLMPCCSCAWLQMIKCTEAPRSSWQQSLKLQCVSTFAHQCYCLQGLPASDCVPFLVQPRPQGEVQCRWCL